MTKQQFEFDTLCMLAQLGLWEQAAFYAASCENYHNFSLFRIKNHLLLSYLRKNHSKPLSHIIF